MKRYANMLLEAARRKGSDANRALDDFLDYLLSVFDIVNLQRHDMNLEAVMVEAKARDEDMFLLMAFWLMEVTKSMDEGKPLDFFGSMYEELFQGRGKASALGQFYTPEALCTLMARIQVKDAPEGRATYNDPACGSGRTLIAAHMIADRTRLNIYDAGDIDYISCKMCALNMMAHGMVGTVRQQDALLMSKPDVIYHVNEVRYPIPTNGYSIRREYITQEQWQKITEKS